MPTRYVAKHRGAQHGATHPGASHYDVTHYGAPRYKATVHTHTHHEATFRGAKPHGATLLIIHTGLLSSQKEVYQMLLKLLKLPVLHCQTERKMKRNSGQGKL
jgi:hypothetical protein